MIFITLDGDPEIKHMNSIINNFITKYTKDKNDSENKSTAKSTNIKESTDKEYKFRDKMNNDEIFNKLLNDPEIGEIYDSYYRWENIIGTNKQYGFYVKNSEVDRIQRAASC